MKTNTHKSLEPPEARALTARQAARLSSVSGLEADALVGKSVSELRKKVSPFVEQELLLFRRVCGRVVRTGADGVDRPVPFATVHVEDVNCNFLGLFPVEGPWAWLFPLTRCTREDIGSAVTDACGNFCAWIPRWEIEYVLRWRLQWRCFEHFFSRPTIGELLNVPRNPGDPGPIDLDPHAVEHLAGTIDAARVAQLRGLARQSFGASTAPLNALLAQPAFPRSVAPPVPLSLRHMSREQLAHQLDLAEEHLSAVDLNTWVGPFWKCERVLTPEWMPILDVPDIAFRVTQDVNGDGVEEVIYSEGLFAVRWNAGAIPDVTLHASQIAVAGVACGPDTGPCGDPAIVLAGMMPVQNVIGETPYHDQATGTAGRPNAARPGGLSTSARALPLITPFSGDRAPYSGTLYLYGCNHVPEAAYYQIRYRIDDAGAVRVPFRESWELYRLNGGTLERNTVSPDSDGWYPILDDASGWLPGHLLLQWTTAQSGFYMLDLRFKKSDGTILPPNPTFNIRIDNSAPFVDLTSLQWRVAGDTVWSALPLTCPVIARPAGRDLEFQVSWAASATHLRSAELVSFGCGAVGFVELDAASAYQHWYTAPGDDSVAKTAHYRLPAAAAQGCYSFVVGAASRAFNPAGGDGTHSGLGGDEWIYDPIYLSNSKQLMVSVTDG